ncbi:helix-turn-helix domain-containing protein [Sphingobacterium sp. InxBP1]|uniref:helix-turn-helix domain-containing protein n=1 Tax=Sphingobacterium sp. InxBP1 TaxID=2870328 RepID=UPI002244476B|nr:helix-turn-helix domain-containing protein [Sphingobacterium sp. InxBP1]MCW8310787.1 helix-turn-helix domain-containing protein [Sphingobacterium sp. InxBP1]
MVKGAELNKKLRGFGLYELAMYSDNVNVESNRDFFHIIKAFGPVVVQVEAEYIHLFTGQLLFVGPGKTINFPTDVRPQGYLLSFSQEFYERSSSDSKMLNSTLFFTGELAMQINDEYRNEELFNAHIVERIYAAMEQGTEILDLVVHHCIESLLLDGYYKASLNGISEQLNKSANQALVNSFNVLVHKYYRKHTTVQFYADKLHVTPRKLSDLCTAYTGKSAKTIISDIVGKEAVRLIKHSNLSIAQIAYEMGFTDESNFRNFVKKKTGHIPRMHRQPEGL